MFTQTIAIAAAAVTIAPNVMAQSAGAPTAVEAPDEVRRPHQQQRPLVEPRDYLCRTCN